MKYTILFLMVITLTSVTLKYSKIEPKPDKGITFYVSVNGSDSNKGTIERPFATVTRAQKAIRELKRKYKKQTKTVIVQGGLYELNASLVFTPEDSGNKLNPIVYKAAENENVIMSGGRLIRNWKNIDGDHWVISLPDVKKGIWNFRQLFANGERLTRARTPNEGFYKTKGALTKYNKNVRKYMFSQKLKENDPAGYWESRAGFQFNDNEIELWDNWKDAEILTMHSWESSWQTIRSIDLEKNDVYFNSPCRYPVGSFSKNMRYRIENIPEALDLPNEWYLDSESGELHLLTKRGANPNEMEIFAPYLSRLLCFSGDKEGNQTKYICFENINFKYAKSNFGIYDIAPNWPNEILEGIPNFPKNAKPGYTDSQAAPRCGEAILFEGAEDIVLESCNVMHVGTYGVKIGTRSHRININNSDIYDVGAGGVLIGFPIREVEKEGIPYSDAPSYNVISNCHIHKAGTVYPAAVGLWMAQSHHNKISHNEINDISYSGISNGWTWTPVKNYTKDNTINNNHIHHVAQQLGDAAGLYGLGNCDGTVYFENFLDEIIKGEGVYGVVDAMGFDEHSTNVRIERNVIGKTSGKTVSFHKNGPKDHTWIDNNFDLTVERPKVAHNDNLEPDKISVYTEFKLASSFVNIKGDVRKFWILSKNKDVNTDGFYGMLVEGKKVKAMLNIGGGEDNIYAVITDDVLIEEEVNEVMMTFDGIELTLIVNQQEVKSNKVGKTRTKGNGTLHISPIRGRGASLRYGVNTLQIYDKALTADEIESVKPVYFWEAPEAIISDIDFQEIISRAGPINK